MRGWWLSMIVVAGCSCDSTIGTERRDARAVDATEPRDSIVADAPSDAREPTDAPAIDAPAPACAGWSFDPASPETGVIDTVTYRSTERGFIWIGLELADATVGEADVDSGDGWWSWSFPVAFGRAGEHTATFTADMGDTRVSSCTFSVRDTGPAPPLVVGDCTGKVCGEGDGAGGVCQRCPMVASEGGACMDPPAPIGPGGPGPWACLDSAGCESGGGNCRIWCPGEPCDTDRHPDGCPQGVESCFVPAGITDYEEACRTCCESRRHAPTGEFACWDAAINLCRYPTDCGQPYPLP